MSRTDILLESGTNELEIVEFRVGNCIYGINVAKIREILLPSEVTEVPKSHPCIKGIFKPRDKVMSVIDLALFLGKDDINETNSRFIVTEFNQITVAFEVHGVTGIRRVSWKDIEGMDASLTGGDGSSATGVIKFKDSLVILLDFEKILAEISPESTINSKDIIESSTAKTHKIVILAEDSSMLSVILKDSLVKAGYKNIISHKNGDDALKILNEMKDKYGEDIHEHIACVISDIEMPQMDGHTLTKLIKSDPILQKLPVILFSSLITDEIRKKGVSVGADEQISKPQIGVLVDIVNRLA